MSLTDLLGKIRKGPALVHGTGDGGAVIALALHCLMVKSGYQVTPATSQNSLAPASDWNSKFSNEWVFEYTRKGFDSVFVLHCSLAAPSGKMFVHGRERDNPKNMHNLGLQVNKYITEKSKLERESWEGVLDGEAVLEEMFQEYISMPLARQAIPLPSKSSTTIYDRGQAWIHRTLEHPAQRDILIPIVVGVASLGIAAVCVQMFRQRTRAA